MAALRALPPAFLLLVSTFVWATAAFAHESNAVEPASWSEAPSEVAVREALGPPPAGVTDLKFREFFRLPVGPRGLEPTAKLLGLDGRRIRIVGYMVRQETASAGSFVLAPMPVTIGDADESLSDDLPPSSIFVHLPGANDRKVTFVRGLIQLTGTLSVGAKEESDGRVSTIRLLLDPAPAAAILKTQEQFTASQSPFVPNR